MKRGLLGPSPDPASHPNVKVRNPLTATALTFSDTQPGWEALGEQNTHWIERCALCPDSRVIGFKQENQKYNLTQKACWSLTTRLRSVDHKGTKVEAATRPITTLRELKKTKKKTPLINKPCFLEL